MTPTLAASDTERSGRSECRLQGRCRRAPDRDYERHLVATAPPPCPIGGADVRRVVRSEGQSDLGALARNFEDDVPGRYGRMFGECRPSSSVTPALSMTSLATACLVMLARLPDGDNVKLFL